MILQEQDVQIITDLMMGGDGKVEKQPNCQMGKRHRWAMNGKPAATSLSSMFGKSEYLT